MEEPDNSESALESLRDSQISEMPHILIELEEDYWEEEHKSRNLNDIAEGRVPRPPWLFDDFLLSHSLTLVSGEPFAGKTMLLAAMLLSLDSGEPLAGAFMPQPKRRVLFIGQDAPTWDYMGQIQKLSRATPSKTTPFSKVILNNGFNILEPRFLSMVEKAVDLFNINVLMLDTLLELHGMDENSNTEMRRVMGALKYLRDKHFLSIIVTTHTSKDSEGKSSNYRARGASVIAGSADQHLIVRTHKDGFSFRIPKSRGAKKSTDSSIIKFVGGETSSGLPFLRLEYAGEAGEQYAERQNQAIDLIKSGKTTRKDILAGLAILYPAWTSEELQRRTTNTLAYLVKKNQLTNPERGLYSLPPEPK